MRYRGGRQKLVEILIDAGTIGIKTHDLGFALRHHLFSDEIKTYLNQWLTEGKVQKFVIEGKPHRPITMWRALASLEPELHAPPEEGT